MNIIYSMLDETQLLKILQDIDKNAYINCIIDIFSELKCLSSKICSDIQLIIKCAEDQLQIIKDAECSSNKILSVLEASEDSFRYIKLKFLNKYHLWLNNCLSSIDENSLTLSISRHEIERSLVNSIPKADPPRKNNLQSNENNNNNNNNNNNVIVIDDSEPDIKIVNEIKYIKSYEALSNHENGFQTVCHQSVSNEEKTEEKDTHFKLTNQFLESNEKCISFTSSYSNTNIEILKTNDDPDVCDYDKNDRIHVDLKEESFSCNNDISSDLDSSFYTVRSYFQNSDNVGQERLSVDNAFETRSSHTLHLTDEKVHEEPFVVINHSLNNTLAKYKHSSMQSKIPFEDKKFERLIDLSVIEKKRSEKCSSVNTSKKSSKKIDISPVESEIDNFTDLSDDNSKNYHTYSDFSDTSKSNQNIVDENEKKLMQELLKSDTDSDEFSSDSSENIDASCNKKQKNIKKKSKIFSKSDSTNEDGNKSRWLNDKLLHFKLTDTNLKRRKNTEKGTDGSSNSINSVNSIEKKRKLKKKKKVMNKCCNNTDSSDLFSVTDEDNDQSMNFKLTDANFKRRQMYKRKIIIGSEKSNNSINDINSIEKKKKLREKKNMAVETSNDTDDSVMSWNSDIVISADENDEPSVYVHHEPDVQILSDNLKTVTKKLGRRNIRQIFDDKEITEGTKLASKDEDNRLQRLAKRKQQLDSLLIENECREKDSLILDIDPETKKELVVVDRGLVKHLKPHQKEGIRFMWDACFESLDLAKNALGSGCILAHCMGLGKTFQVITLAHTVLTNSAIGIKTVMVVCPMNTIHNWMDEFDMWQKNVENKKKICVFELTQHKKLSSRLNHLKSWHENGGVLIINYEMFRSLTSDTKKFNQLQMTMITSYLIDPGADLVVCDEGHLLKNGQSILAATMQRIKTKRRITLTGTPLQNNLKEYHCMIQFVKPNLLGTKTEFLNRFSNPITNGQFDNSTPHDVKLMKHRAHVLNRMLKGCVQRCDYAVLKPFLPPKQEYVILIRLSSLQQDMYNYFLKNVISITTTQCSLFKNYHEIKRMMSHPLTMQLKEETRNKHNKGEVCQILNKQNNNAWWSEFVKKEHLDDLTVSYKLILLFGILERCEKEGDKLLVFSQCLHTLDTIENFLTKIDKYGQLNNDVDEGDEKMRLFDFKKRWKNGLDYVRLDGCVNAERRNVICKQFNDTTNKRMRLFLISTKAGGLGINLTGANRVVLYDPSWNPSNDVQSIFRVFRFGQTKPCYVYRFVTAGTMEEKIYNRQVTKLSLSLRVIDEHQIKRHYRDTDLAELYNLEPLDENVAILNLPKDRVLADVFLKFKRYVYNFFEHDSLLENKEEEELDEEERKQAWLEYEQEKLRQSNFDAGSKNKAKVNQRKHIGIEENSEINELSKAPTTNQMQNNVDQENSTQQIHFI